MLRGKTRLNIFAVLAFMLLFGDILSPSVAEAGFDIKVTNSTNSDCRVEVWESRVLSVQRLGERTLSPGQTANWKTHMTNCAAGFTGEYFEKSTNTWVKIQSTNARDGNRRDDQVDWGYKCGDMHFSVCRKQGQPGAPARDNDFGFCRQ